MLRVSNVMEPKDFLNFSVHLARYKFTHRVLEGNASSVLDYGCGTAYGSAFLANNGLKVFASDLGETELAAEWSKLKMIKNLEFVEHRYVPELREVVDAVVSLEVIEHLEKHLIPNYFETIAAVLNPRTEIFIASTPRMVPIEERSENRRRYHVQEFTYNGFRSLLQKYFTFVSVFSQNDTVISDQNPAMAWNYLAICHRLRRSK